MLTLLFAAATALHAPLKVDLEYTLSIDAADLSGYTVTLRARNAPAGAILAAHAHPEYDDKYWRYLEPLTAMDANGNRLRVEPVDSVLWRIDNRAGDLVVRYRLRLPPAEHPRAPWKPFLTRTGGLVGGPHSFLYVVGQERARTTVRLDLPAGWRIATGYRQNDNLFALLESPMLVGEFSDWTFAVGGVPHRIAYWRKPDGVAFDTATFANGVKRVVEQTFALFGRAPYRDYTFIFQDGAYSGGLEHPNSATLGAESAELARNPYATLQETAHEFVHTWNLMHIKPVEYREVDYRAQPPTSGLWFSEGLTLFYADLLLRRAGLPAYEPTRSAHLESLIARYHANPGNARFSAEQVSRVAYNAGPGALGDYTASAHLQGELIGMVLDLVIRDATDGVRSMDDVMRLMTVRFGGRGFTSSDVERVTSEVCQCSVREIFERHVRSGNPIDFNHYLALIGLRADVRTEASSSPDLRIWGYRASGEEALRLQINDPSGPYGRAGLHTTDKLISINGTPVTTWPEMRSILARARISDALQFVIERAGERQTVAVVVSAQPRTVVSVIELPTASEQARRLRAAWLAGK